MPFYRRCCFSASANLFLFAAVRLFFNSALAHFAELMLGYLSLVMTVSSTKLSVLGHSNHQPCPYIVISYQAALSLTTDAIFYALALRPALASVSLVIILFRSRIILAVPMPAKWTGFVAEFEPVISGFLL